MFVYLSFYWFIFLCVWLLFYWFIYLFIYYSIDFDRCSIEWKNDKFNIPIVFSSLCFFINLLIYLSTCLLFCWFIYLFIHYSFILIAVISIEWKKGKFNTSLIDFSFCLSIHHFIDLFVSLIYISIHLLFIYFDSCDFDRAKKTENLIHHLLYFYFVCLFIILIIYLSTCQSIILLIYLSIHLFRQLWFRSSEKR